MGNRAECPVCKSYTSSVYHALNYEMGCCPTCQAPYDILRQWNSLKEELEALQEKRVEKDLIQQIKDVHEENAVLKTKLSRLENLLGYDNTIVKPILEAIKILNNQEDEDDDEDPNGYNYPKHRQSGLY